MKSSSIRSGPTLVPAATKPTTAATSASLFARIAAFLTALFEGKKAGTPPQPNLQEAKLAELIAHNTRLVGEMSRGRSERASLAEDLQKARSELDTSGKETRRLAASIQELEARCGAAEAAAAVAQKRCADAEALTMEHLAANAALEESGRQIKSKLDDVTALNLKLVARLRRQPPRSLGELVERCVIQFADRIVFTRQALDSAEDSPYAHLERAEETLQCLYSEFYPVFVGQQRMAAALSKLPASVRFEPKMTEHTMGRFSNSYSHTYKGRAADLNRHLCLGNAFDPAHCARIHFEWDETDQLIVVHHIGRHLKTQSS